MKIFLYLSLALLTACTQPITLSNVEDDVEIGESFPEIQENWISYDLSPLPFSIQLPSNANIKESDVIWLYQVAPALADSPAVDFAISANSKIKSKLPESLLVTSNNIGGPYPDANDPGYFFFTISKANIDFKNEREFFESICPEEYRLQEYKGQKKFSFYNEWEIDGMKVVNAKAWACPFRFFGALIVYRDAFYIISLPDGDWGKEGGKFFTLALKSIRPL